LSSLTAALFIVAEIATGGLATAALFGGVALGGAQALASWDNYETLSAAAGSAASPETQVVSAEQVKAARLEAILNTIFAIVDLGQIAAAARSAAAAARVGKAAAERGAEAGLRDIGKLGEKE